MAPGAAGNEAAVLPVEQQRSARVSSMPVIQSRRALADVLRRNSGRVLDFIRALWIVFRFRHSEQHATGCGDGAIDEAETRRGGSVRPVVVSTRRSDGEF